MQLFVGISKVHQILCVMTPCMLEPRSSGTSVSQFFIIYLFLFFSKCMKKFLSLIVMVVSWKFHTAGGEIPLPLMAFSWGSAFPNWWKDADMHEVINNSKYFRSWRFHFWSRPLWFFRAEQTTPFLLGNYALIISNICCVYFLTLLTYLYSYLSYL